MAYSYLYAKITWLVLIVVVSECIVSVQFDSRPNILADLWAMKVQDCHSTLL